MGKLAELFLSIKYPKNISCHKQTIPHIFLPKKQKKALIKRSGWSVKKGLVG